MNSNPDVCLILGIRPDIIRASLIINDIRSRIGDRFSLIWSGQHYSDNLKDVFFRELEVAPPEYELGIRGKSDAELVSSLIKDLYIFLEEKRPKACVFLGDTNTVMGGVAAAQLNIPILHIEGGMRSYDWRMPEEKYRKVIDHLSDVIYAYLPGYASQAEAEGIPRQNLIVTGNPIVDVLERYFLSGKLRMEESAVEALLVSKYGIKKSTPYVLMTSHRRENVEDAESLERILSLTEQIELPVIFPMSYRTLECLSRYAIAVPRNVIQVEPVGYLEILELMVRSTLVLSDSGTLIEEAAILGIPSIQMRRSTERPEVYDWQCSVKFDPGSEQDVEATINRALSIKRGSWKHDFGDGKASVRIVDDICKRIEDGSLKGHDPKLWGRIAERSYKSEVL